MFGWEIPETEMEILNNLDEGLTTGKKKT